MDIDLVEKNPDNYVLFNNELWRIIGSIPTKQADGTTKNLVKIIRNDYFVNVIYDGSNSITWGENTLAKLLNNYYYSSNPSLHLNATSTSYKSYANMVDCEFGNVGILSNSYYGKMVKEVYWNTGVVYDSSKSASSCYLDEKNNQTILKNIGLLNVSDYLYASDSFYHAKSQYITDYGLEAAATNWLNNNVYEWTMNMYKKSGFAATNCAIRELGIVSTSATNAFSFRPVLYLNEETFLVSGKGTINNPYIIGYVDN